MANTLHIIPLTLGFLSTMFQKMDLFPLPDVREEKEIDGVHIHCYVNGFLKVLNVFCHNLM